MPKWVKFIIGLLLLPFCLGGLRTLGRVLEFTGSADTFWAAFAAGAACWVVVYLLLPKPMWIYVVGHELTHAVWTWIFGGRVKRFKATSRGGRVVITRSNFVIGLAPYFFPIYAVLVVLCYALGHLIWGWGAHRVWLHLLLGAAYAFHVTLTAQVLQIRQTDITQEGYLFSTAIIIIGNLAVLILGLPLLTARVGIWETIGWWLHDAGGVYQRVGRIF